MGVVYLGYDPTIDRQVAIKTIDLQAYAPAQRHDLVRRTLREVRLAGRLHHPNIVTVYDAGEEKERFYIAMEYIAGRTLKELLRSGVALNLEQKLEILAQTAEGLAYAHARGVIHRDIKPENLIITKELRSKIADFGIAKPADAEVSQDGQILGTPTYMSPEQITGAALDARSDIFSLGVIFYELLSGKQPFGGDTTTTVLYNIIHEPPAPLINLDRSVAELFDQVLRRALAKRPQERFTTAEEFGRALRGFLRRSSLPALPRLPRWPADSFPKPSAAGAGGSDTIGSLKTIRLPRNQATLWAFQLWSWIEKYLDRLPPRLASYGVTLALLATALAGLAGWGYLQLAPHSVRGSGPAPGVAAPLGEAAGPTSPNRPPLDWIPPAPAIVGEVPKAAPAASPAQRPEAVAAHAVPNLLEPASPTVSQYEPRFTPAPLSNTESLGPMPVPDALLPKKVYDLAEVEERPRTKAAADPEYPAPARAARLEESVVLRVLVGADGKALRAEVLSSSGAGFGFEEAAVHAALRSSYHPARRRGEAVPCWLPSAIHFRLPETTAHLRLVVRANAAGSLVALLDGNPLLTIPLGDGKGKSSGGATRRLAVPAGARALTLQWRGPDGSLQAASTVGDKFATAGSAALEIEVDAKSRKIRTKWK
jgi:serine/threonine-protein kinase